MRQNFKKIPAILADGRYHNQKFKSIYPRRGTNDILIFQNVEATDLLPQKEKNEAVRVTPTNGTMWRPSKPRPTDGPM